MATAASDNGRPTLTEDIYQQVCAHPKYRFLSEETRAVFEEMCMRQGPTVNIPQNNLWAAELWDYLYSNKRFY